VGKPQPRRAESLPCALLNIYRAIFDLGHLGNVNRFFNAIRADLAFLAVIIALCGVVKDFAPRPSSQNAGTR
jgi:hypothetical protein